MKAEIPDFQTLMRPVLELGVTGTVSARDAVQQISDRFDLNEEQRQQLIPSGRQPLIFNRTHWTITHLVKAGALERPIRAHFRTTDRGRDLLAEHSGRITMKELARFEEYQAFASRSGVERPVKGASEPSAALLSDETATPDERIVLAIREIDDELRQELLNLVLGGTPTFFERLVIDLLVAMGYGGAAGAGRHIGRSGDEGIDGVIDEDALGLDVVYLQAKRYAPDNSIGREQIQQFAGALVGQGANKGVFVTTSRFTQPAIEYAGRVPQRIVLVDGEMLTNYMMRYGVGVRTETTYRHRKVDLDYFEADGV